MNERPLTIALVHGAFAESASWGPVIDLLHGADRPSEIGDVIAVANPLRSLAGDAAYVGDVLRHLEGPIVLVGHSYGGMVITEAAAACPSVVGLVYVAAFAPDHGESAFQLSTMFPGSTLGETLDAYPVSSGGDEVKISPDRFHGQFADDAPAALTTRMAVTQRPITLDALSAGLGTDQPAWATRPSWFVFGDQDRCIPVALQRHCAARAGARGRLEVTGASHAISISQPSEVCASILDAAATVAHELSSAG